MRKVLLFLAVGVALSVAALSGCGGETSGDVQTGPAGSGAVRVVMEDNRFRPDVLDVSTGSPVTIEVRNAGEANHNFTIDDLDTSTAAMESGDVMTVTFTPREGSAEFRCTFHSDMVGQIVAT